MPARERRKGASGENEVRAAFTDAGFRVDALQRNRGDELDTLATGYGLTFAVESKRCNVLRVPEWTRQAERGAPTGTIPVVTYRRDHEPWYAVVRLDYLLYALTRLARENASLSRENAAHRINVAALREQLARYEDAAPPTAS